MYSAESANVGLVEASLIQNLINIVFFLRYTCDFSISLPVFFIYTTKSVCWSVLWP